MQLIDMIFYWAKTDPHRSALVQPEMITTYQALADAIVSIGDKVESLNLDRTQPIAVSLTNPSYFIAAALAILSKGYSVALIRPHLFPLLGREGIRNLIYDSQAQMLSGGRNIRFDPSWLPQAAGQRSYPRTGQQNVQVILFTSGTTGLPKKIVQSAASIEQLLKYPMTCASGPQQKILIMPGLATTFGFNRLCEVLDVGKTAYFAPDGETALSLIELFGVQVVVASAAQALTLVAAKAKQPDARLSTLEMVFAGGGKIEPEGIARIRTSLCRNVLNQYGSTEAGVAALTPFDCLADQPGAIPLPWAEVEVVDEAGKVLPADSEGIIRYRTPQLAENIKGGGVTNVPSVRDGWFYPGDIGTFTSDGVLKFAGRSSDVINRGGVKVSATRIEEVLQSAANIKEAAACGVAGKSGLEEVWIAVVANGPVDVDQIKSALRAHPDISIEPDEVFLIDSLPRGDLGKIQKYILKDQLVKLKSRT